VTAVERPRTLGSGYLLSPRSDAFTYRPAEAVLLSTSCPPKGSVIGRVNLSSPVATSPARVSSSITGVGRQDCHPADAHALFYPDDYSFRSRQTVGVV
jgi:hypothetical protein